MPNRFQPRYLRPRNRWVHPVGDVDRSENIGVPRSDLLEELDG